MSRDHGQADAQRGGYTESPGMPHHVHVSCDTQYSVCFVCSGNICRSPMGEIVLRRLVDAAGMGGKVIVDSAGTGDWHIGEQADRRAVSALSVAGYDGSLHRARQFDPRWFAERDLVIALDRSHERALRSWAPDATARAKVRLLRSFDPHLPPGASGSDLDVPDPYYDGDGAFDEVLHQVEGACRGLLDHIRTDLSRRAAAR